MAAPDTSPIEGHEEEATRDQLAVAIEEHDYSPEDLQAALAYENGPEGLGRKNATELLQGAFDEATNGPDTPDTSAEPAVTTATAGERDTSTDDESAPEEEVDVDEEDYLETTEDSESEGSGDSEGGEADEDGDENDDTSDVTIDADEPPVPDGSPDVMTGMDVSLDEMDENNQVESRRLYDGGGATESGTAGVVLPAPGTADSPDTVRVFVPLEMNVGQNPEVLSPGVHDVEYTRQVKNQLETETNRLRLAASDPHHPEHETPTA